jgi:hypothetical protein
MPAHVGPDQLLILVSDTYLLSEGCHAHRHTA